MAPEVALGAPAGAHHDHHHISLGFESPGPPTEEGPFELALELLMAYQIFPPRVGCPAVGRAPVQEGDRVGLLYRPLGGVGMFFASRVAGLIDRSDGGRIWRGFTYQTLQDHPELGEESFLISKDALGEVHFHMISWSVPGHPLVRALAPLARVLQNWANRSALEWMRTRVLERLAPGPPIRALVT